MPSVAYDREAVKAELVQLGDAHPRQGSALGRAAGTSAASANRWLRASYPDVPDPDRWSAIEDFFGLRSGHLARVAGLSRRPPATSAVGQLAAAVQSLTERVDELERQIGTGPNAEVLELHAASTAKDHGHTPKGSPTRPPGYAPAEQEDW